MKIDKIDIKGNKQPIEVADKVFGCKINKDLISQVLYKSNANFKGRKAKTKQKNEIVGSTSKIYAQKGTGNARHASSCLLYTSPSPRDVLRSRMPSSA